MKKFFAIIMVISMMFCISITSFATSLNSRGIYLRELVDYDPEQLSYNYTYKVIAQVSGDNTNGDTPLTISLTYSSTETTNASFGVSTLVSAEKNLIAAKVSAEAEFDVVVSRSWTKGESCSAVYNVPAGKKQRITAYMPRISTMGSLKYKVHMDGYSNYWYEYSTLPTTYLPAKNYVHFVTANM